MKKFQYEVDELNEFESIPEDKLTEMGKAGWELIVVERFDGVARFYFKREIEE